MLVVHVVMRAAGLLDRLELRRLHFCHSALLTISQLIHS
jgi:hypothetical protein